jgi:hypothetical protein
MDGPVALFSLFLPVPDIRRAFPYGKLCEFVPRRDAEALNDFITGILLQLSGRYGDSRLRVLAVFTGSERCGCRTGTVQAKKTRGLEDPPVLVPSYYDS